MIESLRDQLAREKYERAAKLKGWSQPWSELTDSSREWWREPLPRVN